MLRQEQELTILLHRWEALLRRSEALLRQYDTLLDSLDVPGRDTQRGRMKPAAYPHRHVRARVLRHPALDRT